ncbi:uncharacterized protein STEHIDRAFT_152702 [Stereum hirsutum FP-91666 SS1]|uniref:uncharacterized protein n=1 Tax=Stereum hirsutum (strain FP-91666) TaxID=721885 RepID=UPI000440C277|nr:uncharacterized protein STEHIDRAFT_152702 [Stereum hirsutum FP-91666 SS1]EIM91019.1 hypothetical protein STEHIDRAFT_152702 [Stereum hirsutum FP-91666 SS1]
MHMLVSSTPDLRNPYNQSVSRHLPVVALLLLNIPEFNSSDSSPETFSRTKFMDFLWDVFAAEVQWKASQSSSPLNIEGAVSEVLGYHGSWSLYMGKLRDSLGDSLPRNMTEFMTRGMNVELRSPHIDPKMAKELVKWVLCSNRREKLVDFPAVVGGLPRAIDLFGDVLTRVKDRNVLFRHPKLTAAFDWLAFLLKETTTIFCATFEYPHSSAYLDRDAQGRAFASTFDSSYVENVSSAAYFSHSSSGEHPNGSCTSLCAFQAEILRALESVSRASPSMVLDSRVWNDAVVSLSGTKGVELLPGAYHENWTPMDHRDGVAQTILEALRPLAFPGSNTNGIGPERELTLDILSRALDDFRTTLNEEEGRNIIFRHPKLASAFARLASTLEETTTIFCATFESPLSSHSHLDRNVHGRAFLNVCVDLIQVLQDFDVSTPARHFVHSGLRYRLISRAVEGVHGAFEVDQWNRILATLTGTQSVELLPGTWLSKWTPPSHRDEVRQTILAALRPMAPLTFESVVTIPWNQLEQRSA